MLIQIVRPGGMERPTDSYKETHNLTLSLEDTLFGGQVSNLQVMIMQTLIPVTHFLQNFQYAYYIKILVCQYHLCLYKWQLIALVVLFPFFSSAIC